ncbi:transcription factor SPT20 homolog isoform X1 [Culex quinquefasciatus]|uniref:transcription factor SPT20 homolog isoform X1 n=1 Tax=Culex quinquefasciatus TaxID=7176 RepID=UPI0018E32982|nr:transcription factor SPT20 homolog isoform X1 [Culex quinquefasciatus]
MQLITLNKMRLVCVFALLLTLVAATSSTDSNDSKDVDSDLKRIRIDPALRKALLRALRHLKERQEEESDVLNTTEENFATTILDEILEESTSSQDRSPNVKYYTAETETDNGENEIIKTIIITKPKTTLTPPKEDYARDAVPDPIKERENELIDSNQVARSVVSGSANALGESKDDKAADDKKISVVTAASGSSTTAEVTPTVTTVTPTTTTTKGPTHNSDGENIEKVKSEDVKIYQAPLVAAFTVQQDQLGVPRNVIPLLQSLPKKNPVEFKQSTPMVSTSHPVAQLQPVQNSPQAPATVPTPIPLNTQALEEKTRILEQQLVTLQTQQRIQEQLFRSKILQEQQLILQQQQQLQQERARLEEETRRRLQRFEEEQNLFRQKQIQFQQQQFKIQQQQSFKQFPAQQNPQQSFPQQQNQQQQFTQQQQQQQFAQQQNQQQQQFTQQQNQQQQQFAQQQSQQQQQFTQQQSQQLQFPQQQNPQQPFQHQQLPHLQQHQQFQQQQIPPPPQPQFNLELPRNSPAVQFIPSVSLPGKAIPISVEQQLPFKEPVNFQPNNQAKPNTVVEQVKSISPPAQQFPIIPPSPPQLSKQQLLPLKPFQPFNVNPAPAPLPLQAPLPIDQQLPGLQRTRVFRHETGTGNFGFSQALPHQQSNAPFRPSQPIPLFQQNNGFTPLRNDNQLQNLLVQSGITSRSAEDFNIITKVLALNHGIPQSSSQQMFAKLSPEQQLLFRKK